MRSLSVKCYSCSKAKLQQRLNLVRRSPELPWASIWEPEVAGGRPRSHLLTTPLLVGRVAQSHSKSEENIRWRGKYRSCCTSTQWDIKNVAYAAGARSVTCGLGLRQGPETGWCMSVSRGMASSPFEGTPRELGLARIPWNGHEFQGGAFSVYQKELSGTCGEGDSLLQSCGSSQQADQSDESNSWIYSRWFLGVNEHCSKPFFELQSPPVICKMTKGDPKTRWSKEGDLAVLSPRTERQ